MNDAALSAFERLVELMCEDKNELLISYQRTSWTVDVTIQASPTDVKRLVGAGGITFKSLCCVLRSITHTGHDTYSLSPVVASSNGSAKDFKRFRPCLDWPRDKVASLVLDLAAAAFPWSSPECTEDELSNSSVFEINLSTPSKRAAATFGEALDRVLRVVGIRIGRMLNAKVVTR